MSSPPIEPIRFDFQNAFFGDQGFSPEKLRELQPQLEAARREVTESVWVEARSKSSHVGYGEGCPRHYVTGEDLQTAASFIAGRRDALIERVHTPHDLRRWMDEHRRIVDDNPAAWCAVELALLDLMAKEEGRSVEGLLGVRELRGEYHYSAVVGSGDLDRMRETVRKYRQMGFIDFKIKLTGDVGRDREVLQELLSGGGSQELRVRADFNNAFPDEGQAAAYLDKLNAPLFALEEPLAANQHAALARLAERAAIPIILDESLLRSEQLEALPGLPEHWIVNLRVSKMGGLLRSLDLLESARARGIRVIVGAQVGETSLLTRAGLSVAEQARDILVAQEGAFGRHLLMDDVCDPSVQFGAGGVLDVGTTSSTEVGFGIALRNDPSFLAPL
jgi:L-alanine-DL-glutamate epimerase-like enolase superfamily enzyme